LIYLLEFRARMWAWDRYGPQMKSFGPDVYFVSSFWLLGFVFAIASAPCDFLYLKQRIYDLKKKKKKKKITICPMANKIVQCTYNQNQLGLYCKIIFWS